MKPSQDKPTYGMKAVMQLTGLSADRLRVWERRYGAVRPTRSAGGARCYSQAEVERLQLLQAGVEAGHRISALVAVSNEQLRQYAADKREPKQRAPLIQAISQLDQRELERLLAVQYVGLGLRRFADAVVAPLLREVGERWAQGKLSVAAEHLASITIRSFLTTALQLGTRRSDQPALLFTTLPDELHEIGTLLAALCAQAMGVRAIYLGPNLPVEEICRAAEHFEMAAVAVGGVCLPKPQLQKELTQLRQALPSTVAVWVGGLTDKKTQVPTGVLSIEDLDMLERELILLKG